MRPGIGARNHRFYYGNVVCLMRAGSIGYIVFFASSKCNKKINYQKSFCHKE